MMAESSQYHLYSGFRAYHYRLIWQWRSLVNLGHHCIVLFITAVALTTPSLANTQPFKQDVEHANMSSSSSGLNKLLQRSDYHLNAHPLTSMPSSFAVLINLGLDGIPRNLYSSRLHNERCHSNQIWDPFNQQCRQLYCRENYEIKDLKCVGNDSDSKPFIKFLDAQSKFVNVTLELQTSSAINQQWIIINQGSLIKDFCNQFSTHWEIDINRLINVTLEYIKDDSFAVNFLMMDSNDHKNDDILRVLSQKVVEKRQTYNFLDITVTAIAIHTIVAEIKNFCLKETDMPIWYWNSDFAIETCQNNLTCLYVNQTGRIYYPGEYMGSVLYVENLNEPNHINISSNAVVCEKTLIDDDCPRIMLNHSEYEFRNGRELYAGKHHFEHYELTDNQSVFVCMPQPRWFEGTLNEKIQSLLSTILMLISIFLLTLVLVTFLRNTKIRATVNGFNSINLAACLAIMQISFLANQFIHECRVTAVMFHFFILATISWSSVIAYDMHQVFTQSKTSRGSSAQKRNTYGLIAYSMPLLVISIGNLGDMLNIECIKASYGPVYPSTVCWMRRRRAMLLYFIVPVTLTVLYNLTLYVRIVFNIRSEIKSFSSLRKVTRMSSGSSQTSTISIISSESETSSNFSLNQTLIYVRLSGPLGFTWLLALFSSLVPSHFTTIISIMEYLFIIANTSQGVVLFLAFGVYKKLCHL